MPTGFPKKHFIKICCECAAQYTTFSNRRKFCQVCTNEKKYYLCRSCGEKSLKRWKQKNFYCSKCYNTCFKCACGCEGTISFKKHINGKIYLKGHARKGKPTSEEHKNKISAANTGKKRINPRRGYAGRIWTEEEKTKHSIRAKERGFGKWMNGRKASPETLKKLSEALKGRPCTQETREKISKANAGDSNGMYGKSHSADAKKKISEASIKGWEENREKRMEAINTEVAKMNRKNARAAMILPLKDTAIELKIKIFLDAMGIEYYQQHHVYNIEHAYQCDFYLPSRLTIIECDGIYWHQYPKGREIDHTRTKEMRDMGYKVIRIWEHDILKMDEEDFSHILETGEKSLKLQFKPNVRGYNYKVTKCERLFSADLEG